MGRQFGIPKPSVALWRAWRRQEPAYRYVMTDIGRSFLMREMRLRRVPGMWRLQQKFRTRFPAQRKDLI
jgi:mannosyltransferase OCH1-like enzyme